MPGAGLLRRVLPDVTPGMTPVQTGECWCIWKRRSGVTDIWRTTLWWKRKNCCPPGKTRFQYHSQEFEDERPGEIMYAPGEFNTTRTKGIWNATIGCMNCPEPNN